MKAPDFAYERPSGLSEALSLLADTNIDARPLAGGQSYMPMMNFRMAAPDLLVDLNDIAELVGIHETGETITIGAMTRFADLERSEVIARSVPLIAKALPFIAHPAIRNRGTIGGSLALADPAAEMPALMIALDAAISVQSTSGKRSIPASAFFTGVYETALEEGELITSISIARENGARPFAFRELARRHGDYAMAGLALTAAGPDPMTGVRIAGFGIADRAIRLTTCEAALEGAAPRDPAALGAAVEALQSIEFNSDLHASAATRRHLTGVLMKRALEDLA